MGTMELTLGDFNDKLNPLKQRQQGTDHCFPVYSNNSPDSGSTILRGLPDFPG